MMSSSAAIEPGSTPAPATTPSSPALKLPENQGFQSSTPNLVAKKHSNPPLNVILPATAPATPPIYGEPTLTPPPRSPCGVTSASAPPSGDGRSHHPPDGTSSDKSSETAVGGVSRTPSTALSRKESYKAQRQNYRKEKKRAATALLHSIEDPSVVVLADWLKVRGSLKSWTKLWCVLKPGLLLLYKSPKAKSSHWVGTVLLTSCQVIERPSKKDGFCFKLYHPLEQSIWAPRGPHNETIGAVVQPLPTAHLIFRAPSQAAGHCWLDGLELALRCSNAMLRCSRSQPEQTVAADAPVTDTNISHEELEKHFNEHVLKMSEVFSCSSPTPLMFVSDYSPKRHNSSERKGTYVSKNPKPTRKISKWAQFMDTIEKMSKDVEMSTDSQTPESEKPKDEKSFLDFNFLRKIDVFERNTPSTSSVKVISEPKLQRQMSKSLACSPVRPKNEALAKKSPILRCFEMPKLPSALADKPKLLKDLSPTAIIEDNFAKFIKRRSSTPSTVKSLTQKRISELRESGAKTDSENDDVFLKTQLPNRKKDDGKAKVICDTQDNIIITKTAPSIERFRKYSSSSTDDIGDFERSDCSRKSPTFRSIRQALTPEKFSLIDYHYLPSCSLEGLKNERRDERFSSQNVYVTGKIVQSELAGAASDSDSDGMAAPVHKLDRRLVLARIQDKYTEDPDTNTGEQGDLIEEVSEENKSLLWFLLKQVRPGMDLSKVVLPTFILEPRSFLDKLSDSYYHADILSPCNQMDDPYLRFKCVLRWYLSGLYRKPKGLKKPYNPVLGEVFRCCWKHGDEDKYTFYIAEQVSHHPPVSAFYVSNRKDGFVIEGSLLARSKFYGNSTSAILEGCARIHLLKWGETYVTTAPYAHCKGIVIGQLSMELGGKVHINCPDTGYSCDVEFKLRSFLGGADQTNAISGRIKKGKDTIAHVDGYWDGRIEIKDKKTGEECTLVDVSTLKEQRMPRYLVKLDHQQEFESQRLWVKVSEAIAREDQHLATEEKTIIEEGQRSRAKNQLSPWVPRYFNNKESEFIPPEGVIDQGWKYNHMNTSPWQPDEVIEYEDDFVIRTLSSNGPASLHVALTSADRLGSRLKSSQHEHSDSDTHDEVHRRVHTQRTLKQSLIAIDTALREHTVAIERLTKTVQTMSERSNAAFRPQNVGRLPTTSHTWDLFAGFVLAMVFQALLSWIFYHKD